MNIESILQEIEHLSGDSTQIVVGFSGGLDSSVLLHILSQSRLRTRVNALHVNHGLSAHSKEWAEHCQRQCRLWGIPLTVESVTVEREGGGLEEAARNARYKAFERYSLHAQAGSVNDCHSSDGVCFLTAHHGNDHAETILFRLFRGTGIKGLGGIQRVRLMSKSSKVIRPLLRVSKHELEEYSAFHSLSVVEDESNQDELFDRNYLRHQVLPAICKRWPHALEQLAKLSFRSVENTSLLKEYALEDLTACGVKAERVGFSLDIAAFSLFNESRQHHVLREWARSYDFDAPLPVHLAQVSRLLNASSDAIPAVEWGSSALARFNHRLFLLPRSILKPELNNDAGVNEWDANEPRQLPDGFELDVSFDACVSACLDVEFGPVNIRFRRGGERCKPLGRNHSQTLKKLLQEYGLEPWLRYRVPLIYKNDDLIAVGDLWWCKDFGPVSIKWTYFGGQMLTGCPC